MAPGKPSAKIVGSLGSNHVPAGHVPPRPSPPPLLPLDPVATERDAVLAAEKTKGRGDEGSGEAPE